MPMGGSLNLPTCFISTPIQASLIDRHTPNNILKRVGLIRLSPSLDSNDLVKATSPQQLTVVAFDDGSCCNDQSRFLKHVSKATVHVVLKNVNNHAPQFLDCSSYSTKAELMEGIYDATNSPTIIRVHAFDNDTNSDPSDINNNIAYSLYYSHLEQRRPFTIDADSGELKPVAGFMFDRELKPSEEVTVRVGSSPVHIYFCGCRHPKGSKNVL